MQISDLLFFIGGYVILVNLVGYLLMSMDKSFAQKSMGRVPEATLLMLAFLGGSLGVVAVQKIERHKTRKKPF